MRTVYRNARVLPAFGEESFYGAVAVEGEEIVGVCRGEPPCGADETVDCGGNLLTPAFANAHAHSGMTLLRGIADDLPLEAWLYDRIFPLEKLIGDEENYWGTKLALLEYARGGVAAVGDMYGDVADAFRGTGFALAMLGGRNDLALGAEEVLKEADEMSRRYRAPRLCYRLGIHAEYTCSDALIYGMADLAAEKEAPVNVHLSETLKEVGECDVRRGMSPAAFFHRAGLFDYGGLAAHCVWCDKDDLALLADKGVVPVLCPSSNLKLGSGIAPASSMFAAGLAPALGTDGAASNNALSVLKEAALVSALAKGEMKDAAALPAETALKMASENGYRALGLAGGRIEKGLPADFVLFDLSDPSMRPLVSPEKSLAYAADRAAILMTVAGGKRVYERGEYRVGEDADEIYRRTELIAKKLRARAEEL